jgi:hypothetical protein
MPSNTVTDRASETGSLPPATLTELRESLLSGSNGGFDYSVHRETAEAVMDSIAAGRLIDAGRISEQTLAAGDIPKDADRKYRSLAPIILSFPVFGVDQSFLLVPHPSSGGEATLLSLAAKRRPNGKVLLTAVDNLAGSRELRRSMFEMTRELFTVLRYLSAGKDAITPAEHNGVAYSKLDVEKAIRIKAPALSDDARPLTLGEARRALVETSESGFRTLEGGSDSGLQRLQAACREAKEGRLFVAENLSMETVSAREADAGAAFRSGDLRPPFQPQTFILATIAGARGPSLFAVTEDPTRSSGFGHFCAIFSVAREGARIVWRVLPGDSPDWEPFQICAVVLVSIIADNRYGAKLVETDEKLNKARIKSGKAAILPYWKIESPGPTVLVPGVATPRSVAAKGGMHASPRPHDRRGHPRHLSAGRVVWVRPSRINALLPHLTRDRAYYELRLKEVVRPSLDGEDAKR